MAMSKVNGAAMRVIRERSGMTVDDLVQRLAQLGLRAHPDTIRNIELGHRQPSVKLLAGIAEALACPKFALYGDPTEPAVSR